MKQILVLVLLSVFLASGCKFFRKRAASPEDTLVADTTSSDTMMQDTASFLPPPASGIAPEVTAAEHAAPAARGTYYMIVGSFSVPQNADNYARKLKGMGYDALVLQGAGGFNMVSARSYSSMKEIVSELDEFRTKIDPGSWVYKAK